MQFQRTISLIGSDAVDTLSDSHVAIFGIGGVGGYACEALARAGVGELTLIDSDDIDITNLNRQIIALHSTIGEAKVDVMRDRICDINPNAKVHTIKSFYLPENADMIDLSKFDYIVDAIDTVSAKLELIKRAYALGVPIISSMGTGNKLDPTRFEVEKISKTSVCPLAKIIRKELKKVDINDIKVVYSKEEPQKSGRTPASISFVPSVAGLIMAGEIIKDLISYSLEESPNHF